jgi:hypothetical protein
MMQNAEHSYLCLQRCVKVWVSNIPETEKGKRCLMIQFVFLDVTVLPLCLIRLILDYHNEWPIKPTVHPSSDKPLSLRRVEEPDTGRLERKTNNYQVKEEESWWDF